MIHYEYKLLPAPTRGLKAKGVKTPEARFAHALEEAINAEAAEGWEYLRADTLPNEERQGLTGSATTFRTLLVFRRALPTADARDPHPAFDARHPDTLAMLPPLRADAPLGQARAHQTQAEQHADAPEPATVTEPDPAPDAVLVRPEAFSATLQRDEDLPPRK